MVSAFVAVVLARHAFSEVAASGATVPCRAASPGAAQQFIAHCLRDTDSQRERPPLATDQRAGALVILKAGQVDRVTPKWWGGETAIVWARVAHPAHECLPEEVGTGWVAIDAATSTFDSGAAQGATEEVLTRLRVALLARPLGLRGKAPCGTWWTDRGAECRLAPYFIYCKVTSWTQHTAKLT